MEIRRSACSRAILLERRPTPEPGVGAPLIVIGGESIQLAMQATIVRAPPGAMILIIVTIK